MASAAAKYGKSLDASIRKCDIAISDAKNVVTKVWCIKQRTIVCGIKHNRILDMVMLCFTCNCALFYTPNQVAQKRRALVEERRANDLREERAARKNRVALETRGRKSSWPGQCKACRMRAIPKPGVAC
jgi:hypothetical protein